MSPHTVLFATYTVWDQGWNHLTVCTDSSPTTKSVGLRYIKGRADFPYRHAHLRTLLGEVYPYFLTYRILERYADLRRSLRPPHGSGLIGDIDTLIAATALERNLTVVTTDTDFQRVPDLSAHPAPTRITH